MRRRGNSTSRPAAFALWLLSALLAVSAGLPREARADGLSGYVEYDYSRNDSENRDAGGQSIRTRSDSLTQLYNLMLDRKFSPALRFSASGIFEKRGVSSETEGEKRDTATTNIRPYVSLNLHTPLYYADVSYSRNEERSKPSGSSTITTVRDSYISTLYWTPDGFPDLKIQYFRDHLYDKARLQEDTITDLYQAISNYRLSNALSLYYQGSVRNTDLRLSDTTTKEMINNGRVNYINSWWRRRITLGLDYNITNQRLETTTTGGGEVGLRVFPFAGLSATTDTPETVVLASNPALIDGDLAAGAGINLGLPSTGGDTRPRNMGLDFILATEINTLYVQVDRDVAQVADAFSWRIYTSDDNQNWALRQTVSPAVYSPTYNRFEIRFANVSARYVKAVAAPLNPVIPFASAYPTILVTELQGESRKPASEVQGTQTSTFQNGTLDFRARLVESVNLTYELTGVFTRKDAENPIYTVSNGLSFFRQFDKVFSGRGRVAFESGEEQAGRRDALVYSAAVTAVPFQTLFHSLTFSGKDETVAGKRDTDISILLYNIAKLYEGIDVNIGSGISFLEDAAGRKSQNIQVNAGATIVPNRRVNLTLLYNETNSVASGGNLVGDTRDYTRSGEADLAITPLPTVYLFGSYRIESSTTSPSRNISNYSFNWSPFPDGTLHLTFNYSETIRSDDSKERSIIPNLRWYMTPRSYLNLSYQNLKSETPALATTSSVYDGTVRVSF